MQSPTCQLCRQTTEPIAADGLCVDRVACWAAWDAAHGLHDTEAQRQLAQRQAVAR